MTSNLRKAIESLKDVLEDEESETVAYQQLMLMTNNERLREALRIITEDSIVHAEVVRGLILALEKIETLRSRKWEQTLENSDFIGQIKTHITLEANVSAVYEDIKGLVDVGSIIAILETLVNEEKKHEKILKEAMKLLR